MANSPTLIACFKQKHKTIYQKYTCEISCMIASVPKQLTSPGYSCDLSTKSNSYLVRQVSSNAYSGRLHNVSALLKVNKGSNNLTTNSSSAL